MEVGLSTDNIWVNIFIPIIIGPIFLMVKVLYDRWDFKRKESTILKNKLNLEKINNKLQKFYWPIYILLLKDYNLWSKIKLSSKENLEITETDSESECEDLVNENYTRCSYVKKNDKGVLIYCRNPIAKNCINKFGSYCIKHYHHKNKKILEIQYSEFSNNTINSDFKTKEIVNYNDIQNNIAIDMECKNKVDIDTLIPTDNDNTKLMENEMKEKILESIIDNHDKINSIITEYISIAEPKSQIGRQLVKFLKYSNIFKVQFLTNNLNISPSEYGAAYPKKLLPMIEIMVFKLQKEYNNLINNYYNF